MPPVQLISSPSIYFLPGGFRGVLVIFLGCVIFLSTGVTVGARAFLVGVLLFCCLSFLLGN